MEIARQQSGILIKGGKMRKYHITLNGVARVYVDQTSLEKDLGSLMDKYKLSGLLAIYSEPL